MNLFKVLILKQFLCKHIWKQTKSELLKYTITLIGNIYPCRKNMTYAFYEECLVCGKTRISTEKGAIDITSEERRRYMAHEITLDNL